MSRPVEFWIAVVISMLVDLLYTLPVNTYDPPQRCFPQIIGRKNTVYKVSREDQLNISCTVTYCQEVPVLGWVKIDDKNKDIRIKETIQVAITEKPSGLKEIISYLSFRNISLDDTGIYRCTIFTNGFTSASYNINVNVSDYIEHNTNNNTGPLHETAIDVRRLPYIFICLGILGLVLIVMLISFLCINRYSSDSRNSRRNKKASSGSQPLNTTTTTSGKSLEFTEEQNNLYDATPDDLLSDPGSVHTRTNQKNIPAMRNENRCSDGSQQIVYASLQHPKTFTGRHQSRDQLSEYASIRITGSTHC